MTQTTITDWTTGDTATHNGIVVTLGLFPTSSGYRPAKLGHRCHLGTDCRRFDIEPTTDQACPAFAWECELTPVVDQPTQDSDAFPHVGAEMTWTSPDGRITITVRRGHFAWTVETYQGGTLRIADNCGAYTTETEARAVARGYATMYAAEHAAPAPRITGRPVARGHQLDMSPSQARAIVAAGIGGRIDRGAPKLGRLTDTQIRALAAPERGWVTAVTHDEGRRTIIDGATVGERAYNAAVELLARTNQATATAATVAA